MGNDDLFSIKNFINYPRFGTGPADIFIPEACALREHYHYNDAFSLILDGHGAHRSSYAEELTAKNEAILMELQPHSPDQLLFLPERNHSWRRQTDLTLGRYNLGGCQLNHEQCNRVRHRQVLPKCGELP
jgi:hypothetical protein